VVLGDQSAVLAAAVSPSPGPHDELLTDAAEFLPNGIRGVQRHLALEQLGRHLQRLESVHGDVHFHFSNVAAARASRDVGSVGGGDVPGDSLPAIAAVQFLPARMELPMPLTFEDKVKAVVTARRELAQAASHVRQAWNAAATAGFADKTPEQYLETLQHITEMDEQLERWLTLQGLLEPAQVVHG